MAYCYKLLTESPGRCGSASPRRKSPVRLRSPDRSNGCDTITTELLYGLEQPLGISKNVLVSIPEKDWKLLAVLARKRKDDELRERLADDFRKLWEKEDEKRKLVDAEMSYEYQKYIRVKRDDERRWQENMQLQRSLEQHLNRRRLLDCIQNKEMRTADLLAWLNSKRAHHLVEKALVDEARAQVAAGRRARQREGERWRKQVELETALRREENAEQRRVALLRDASQRAAISNALSSWESSLLRREITAMDAVKRESLINRLAYDEARSMCFVRNRNWRKEHTRKVAAATARLRDVVRNR